MVYSSRNEKTYFLQNYVFYVNNIGRYKETIEKFMEPEEKQDLQLTTLRHFLVWLWPATKDHTIALSLLPLLGWGGEQKENRQNW